MSISDLGCVRCQMTNERCPIIVLWKFVMLSLFRYCEIAPTYGVLINLVTSHKKYDYDSSTSEESSDEEPDYIPHVETTLDFRGTIRQRFAVELGLDARGRNMICSPISAMMPLAKLVFGARKKSKTEKELLNAVGLRDRHEVKGVYKQALKEISYIKGVQISLASRIYVSKKQKLQSKFKHQTQSVFGSAVELIDTNRPHEVANTVNQWVADHTKRKITHLLSESDIDPSISVLLVNAIYFKGAWLTPFKPARPAKFYSPSGTTMVPMMKIGGRFNYIQDDDLNAQIIELPYEGEEAAMIIVLPYEKNGLPILLQTLKVSHELLNTALMKMKTAQVDVTIPKFKIETTIDLKNYYQKMGIRYSFAQELSDLSLILKTQRVHISNAIQKAIIEVTEEGTVAAAASVIEIVPKIVPLPFEAKHPFLFYIRSIPNNEQLFAGVVNRPF